MRGINIRQLNTKHNTLKAIDTNNLFFAKNITEPVFLTTFVRLAIIFIVVNKYIDFFMFLWYNIL